MNPAIVWFILMVVFLIIEAACPLHLVSIWFSIGALAAIIVSLFSGPVWLQIGVFLVVSIALLASLWPFVRKIQQPELTKTNVDALIGTSGYVTADIDNLAGTGQIRLGAMDWTARSASGDPIAAGTLVKVDRIEGVKAIVSPVHVHQEVH